MKIMFCTEDVENPFTLASLCRLARKSTEGYDSEVYIVSPHNSPPEEYADLNHIRTPQTEIPKKFTDWDTYFYLRYFKDISAKKMKSRLLSLEMQLGDLSEVTFTIENAPMVALLAYLRGHQIQQVTSSIGAIPEYAVNRQLDYGFPRYPNLTPPALVKVNALLKSFDLDPVKDLYQIFGNMPTFIRGTKALDYFYSRGGVPQVRYITPSLGISPKKDSSDLIEVMLIELPPDLNQYVLNLLSAHPNTFKINQMKSIHDPAIYDLLPKQDILISDMLHPVQIDALYYNVLTYNFFGFNGRMAELEAQQMSARLMMNNASARLSKNSVHLANALKHQSERQRFLKDKIKFREDILYYPRPESAS